MMRIIRTEDLTRRLGLSRATIFRNVKAGTLLRLPNRLWRQRYLTGIQLGEVCLGGCGGSCGLHSRQERVASATCSVPHLLSWPNSLCHCSYVRRGKGIVVMPLQPS